MTQENQPQTGSPGNQPPPPFPVRTIPVKNVQSKFTVLGLSAFAVGAICLLLALLVVATRPHALGFHRRDHGVGHLRELRLLKLPAQLPQAQSLCTDRGFAILSSLPPGGLDLFRSFKMEKVICNPDMTDVQMVLETAEGRDEVWVRMVNQDGWKFNDILVAEAKGRPIKKWASWMMEHPYRTLAIVHSDEISSDVNAIDTGLDTFSKLLNVANQLRALDQNSHSQRD